MGIYLKYINEYIKTTIRCTDHDIFYIDTAQPVLKHSIIKLPAYKCH